MQSCYNARLGQPTIPILFLLLGISCTSWQLEYNTPAYYCNRLLIRLVRLPSCLAAWPHLTPTTMASQISDADICECAMCFVPTQRMCGGTPKITANPLRPLPPFPDSPVGFDGEGRRGGGSVGVYHSYHGIAYCGMRQMNYHPSSACHDRNSYMLLAITVQCGAAKEVGGADECARSLVNQDAFGPATIKPHILSQCSRGFN